jgi:hypothetical protein
MSRGRPGPRSGIEPPGAGTNASSATSTRETSEPATTVVIARQVRAGRGREAQRWVERICREAGTAPGSLGATAHPPSDAHPNEWLVTYRFASGPQLDAWLDSLARRRLVERGGDLVEEAREQRLVVAPPDTAVTLVSSGEVAAGRKARAARPHTAAVAG